MKTSKCLFLSAALTFAATSCDKLGTETPVNNDPPVSLEEVARMLSELPLEKAHLDEVYSAVSVSSENGYDDEYTMKSLFEEPGSGIGGGNNMTKSSSKPIRSLISEYLERKYITRAGNPDQSIIDKYIETLQSSDLQIYWPNSELWDKKTFPVITFDPMSEATANTGYEIVEENGATHLREVVVTEQMAMERPVWVVNTNDDSKYTSLEMLRRLDPDWNKGSEIIVKSASDTKCKSLVLKKIRINRNFDSWFGGASEIMVKCGSADGFNASTEAELRLFQPSVTDFMIVIKRSQKGTFVPFDAMMISDWTDQMEKFAFLLTEDDGGTTTSWKCEATVKVESKSYGFNLDLPYHDRDDIIWRGTLSSSFFNGYKGEVCHFGDVDIVFDII